MSGKELKTLGDLLRAAAKGESGKKKTLEERERETTLELQKEFAGWTRKIVNKWILGLVIFFLVLAIYRTFWDIYLVAGNHSKKDFLLFSDWVLVTLLGTSTATIVGLPLVVLRGLFPSDKNHKNRSSSTKRNSSY